MIGFLEWIANIGRGEYQIKNHLNPVDASTSRRDTA